jgi:hypothetical protein
LQGPASSSIPGELIPRASVWPWPGITPCVCENARGPRMRRIVFSIAFFRHGLTVQLVSTSTKSRLRFYTQVSRRTFHTAWTPTRSLAFAASGGGPSRTGMTASMHSSTNLSRSQPEARWSSASSRVLATSRYRCEIGASGSDAIARPEPPAIR